MAEKVESPLRDIYRQLGIPLAGEGDFADVKPNTPVRAWGNSLAEVVHEAFDPEHARAKRLAQIQDGMLQNFIAGAQAQKAQQSTVMPTVGDVQTLFPGHNELIPPGAYKPTPQAPLQSDEMPVMTGTQQAVVPDTRFQGPMPGVMTPLGQQATDIFAMGGKPLPGMDPTRYREQAGEFFTEAPRPMRTVETGVYSPDMAPSQSMELDKSMKLPPVFQAQVGALQHQLSTRQPQAHTVTEADINLRNQTRLEQLMGGVQEAYPGERQFLESRLSIYNKEARPGSIPYKKDEAQLTQEQAKADVAKPRQEAELTDLKARASHYEAQTKEILATLDAKLRKINAEASAAEAVGSKESIKAFYQEQQALLNRAKAMIDLAQEGRKGKTMDDVSYAKIMDLALQDLNAGVQAEAKQRSWLEKQFGTERPVEITPRPADEPMKRLVPPGMPQGMPQSALPPAQPERAPEPEIEDKAAKQAFGRTLKDGETKSFRGKKYMRKGNQLIEVR